MRRRRQIEAIHVPAGFGGHLGKGHVVRHVPHDGLGNRLARAERGQTPQRALDSSVSVIMVTANEDVELARETLKLGAFDYVAKPFDFSYLEQAVTLGLIQSSGGPPVETGRRGAEATEGPAGVWNALAPAAFRAGRPQSAPAGESTGRRRESAALAAGRDGAAGRTAAAVASLQELRTLVELAAELEDITPALRQNVEAAMSAARGSLSIR